jgi:hypothetical protein
MYSKVNAEIDSLDIYRIQSYDIKSTRPFPSPKIAGAFSFGKEDAKRRVHLPQVKIPKPQILSDIAISHL